MTSKQKLILFFIATEFADNAYKLIKHFDRWNFPADLGENLKPLLNEKLIAVSVLDDYRNPFAYVITEKGKIAIGEGNFHQEILEYAKSLKNSDFMLQITEALIKKNNQQ